LAQTSSSKSDLSAPLSEGGARLAQLALDRAADAVYWLDPEGRLVYVNQSACRMLGYAAEEFRGMAIWDLDPETTPESWPRIWERIKRRGALTFRARHRTKLDELIPVEVSVHHLRHDGRELACGVSRDVSERQRTEEALRVTKEEAERANSAKSRFLAAASHDLRQPLHAMELLTAVLSKKVTGEETQSIIADIQESLALTGRLLNALLDISELEAGTVVPKMQTVEIDPLLRRISQQYAVIAGEKSVKLRVRESRALVRSDPGLLERILDNLTANAVRYTDSGGVLLGCRRRSGKWRIEVWDTGAGIPSDKFSAAFEDFGQLDRSARNRGAGLGLGLGIVRRLADLLGHEISLGSEPGRGTVFRVAAEMVDRLSDAAAVPCEPRRPGMSEGTLVVIDDDEMVLFAMCRALETWGYRVIAAESEDQAVAALALEGVRPDLIIADYRLAAGKTGIEAIETIRSLVSSALPAVIVTGDIAPASAHSLAESGLRVLHKPVRQAKMRALLRHLLEGSANRT
jgi:PAS domain S-box-containing protein